MIYIDMKCGIIYIYVYIYPIGIYWSLLALFLWSILTNKSVKDPGDRVPTQTPMVTAVL